MLGRKYAFLASTALVASLALTACDNDLAPLAPQEFGWLGLPVGQPVEVISATRGDGVSFDSFVITLNADGSVTVDTPEGETINFSEDDIEWAGSDPDLGGLDVAKLTSARGDRLDVMVGGVTVPLPPPPDPVPAGETPTTEEIETVALARLDEVDTRNGFETYGVVGVQTAADALPRYQEDVIVDEGEGVAVAAGELAFGTAYYEGDFMASVFEQGELLTDDVSGWANVNIDFADNDVDIDLEGEYVYDDVDDVMDGTVTGIVEEWSSFVASVNPDTDLAITGFDPDTGTFLTGITAEQAQALTGFSTSEASFVQDVGEDVENLDLVVVDYYITIPLSDIPLVGLSDINIPVLGIEGTNLVVGVNPTGTTALTGIEFTDATFLTELNVPTTGEAITDLNPDDALFVTAVNATYNDALVDVTALYATDTDDIYQVSLSGSGNAGDLGFDGGVQYMGELSGYVEIPEKEEVWVRSDDVDGEFAGAVFGPGSDAETVDAALFGEVVDATVTAGVFEANTGVEDDGGDPQVQIVGGFIAESDGFDAAAFDPAPEPPAAD